MFFIGKKEKLIKHATEKSLWSLEIGLACCKLELMNSHGPRFDIERYGLTDVNSPEQADLLIVGGTVTHKMAKVIKEIYDKMLSPKYVISIGSCSNCGSPFVKNGSYSVLEGIDKIIPVDVYVAGCPPRPEAIFEGILTLQRKISGESECKK